MAETTTASDGFPALVIKPHSMEKLHYFRRYIYLFSTALKPKLYQSQKFRGFSERNYIDLFSGTGKCVVNTTSEEVDGSSLLALKTNYPFSNYYFVDLCQDNIDALKSRVNQGGLAHNSTIKYFGGDCNQVVHQILNNINKQYSVNLAIIDGFGIECQWITIETLASCKRMDLLILFPQGMSINRNLNNWANTESCSLDLFFGTNKWRQIYDKNNGQAHKCIRLFLDLYKDNLCSLGYSGNNQVREILIKSKNGQKLYYLLFASKHPLGNQFWSHATEKPMDGQLRFIGI